MSNNQVNISKLLFASEEELEKLIKVSGRISRNYFGKRIQFYAPSFVRYRSNLFLSSPNIFPSISITGSYCALGCKHCQGRILNTMIPAPTPKKLVDVCRDLKKKGCKGILISGGCLSDGSVPLEKFLEAIAQIKQNLGLTIVVHTGLVDIKVAKKLRQVGVDAALIDVIGSNETISEIYQMNTKVEEYEKSLKALHESEIPTVPHVLVGLHYGKLKGEFQALKMISKYNPAAVITIAFVPINGTVMEDVKPPSPEDIVRVLIAARFMLPNTPLVLGCVRPKGNHRVKTDILSIKAGVNAIAYPTKEAIQLAESMSLKTSFSPVCCSQIFMNIHVQ